MSSGPEATASLDCQAHNPQLGTQMRSQALKQTQQMILGVGRINPGFGLKYYSKYGREF